MPFALALALVAQTAAQSPALPDDNRAAIVTCGAATRAGSDISTLEQGVIRAWFVLTLATIDYPPAEAYQKMSQATGTLVDAAGGMDSNEAAALTAPCRARFARAWASNGVTLPADDFARRALCMYAPIGLRAVANVGRYDDQLPWIDKQVARMGKLVSDAEFTAHNGTRGKQGEGARNLLDSVNYGNLLGVVRACEATFRG